MGYLLSQIWLCLLIAALIGGIIGWLLRGGCRDKIEILETNYQKRLLELERERDDCMSRAGDYDAVKIERDALNDRVSGLQLVEKERDDLNARLAALEASSSKGNSKAATAGAAAAGLVAGSMAADDESETIQADTDAGTGVDIHSSYDIEEVEGIGPGYGKRLRGIGVSTTTELLDKCPDADGIKKVSSQIDMDDEVVRTWTCMSDLMRVQGVGGQYSELLEFSDIHTVSALAQADPEGLTMKMGDVNDREHRVKEVPEVPVVKSWITHAASLPSRLSENIHKPSGSNDKFALDTASIPQSDLDAGTDSVSSYDIEEIEGIGKGYGKKLRELGIATTANMLNQCPDEASMKPVIEAMNLEDWVIHSWATMADLMRVNGIGGQFAELLNFSDIKNVEGLARANASGLVNKMRSVNEKENRVKEVPGAETVSGWIEHAKTLPEMLKRS